MTDTNFTISFDDITYNSVNVVLDLGGSGLPIYERGVVYDLESNPTVDDTIKISGSGYGEFTIPLTGLDYNTIYHARGFYRYYDSNETQPNGDVDIFWDSVAISSNGQIMIAGGSNNRLYITTNGSQSWTEVQPAGDVNGYWNHCGISHDGTIMVVASTGGRVYRSTNTGSSWSETQPIGNNNGSWSSLSMSANGQIIVASIYGGRIYRTTNGGSSWAEIQPSGNSNRDWVSSAMSDDGSTIICIVDFGRAYLTINSGSSWAETFANGNNNSAWIYCTMSGDGNTIVACTSFGAVITKNKGTNWAEFLPYSVAYKRFTATSISTDGNIIVSGNGAFVSGDPIQTFGRLHFSIDGGNTWFEIQPEGDNEVFWNKASITPNGDYIIVSSNKRLYYIENKTIYGVEDDFITPHHPNTVTLQTTKNANGSLLQPAIRVMF